MVLEGEAISRDKVRESQSEGLDGVLRNFFSYIIRNH